MDGTSKFCALERLLVWLEQSFGVNLFSFSVKDCVLDCSPLPRISAQLFFHLRFHSVQCREHDCRWQQGKQVRWESWARLQIHGLLFAFHRVTTSVAPAWSLPLPTVNSQWRLPLLQSVRTLRLGDWISPGILLPGALSCFPLSAWTLLSLCLFFSLAFYSPLVPRSLKPTRLWWHLLGSAGSELQPRVSSVVALAYTDVVDRGTCGLLQQKGWYSVLLFWEFLLLAPYQCHCLQMSRNSQLGK